MDSDERKMGEAISDKWKQNKVIVGKVPGRVKGITGRPNVAGEETAKEKHKAAQLNVKVCTRSRKCYGNSKRRVIWLEQPKRLHEESRT